MRRAVFVMLAVAATLLGARGAAQAQTVPRRAPDAGCLGPRDFQAFLEDGHVAAQTFTATRSGRLTGAEAVYTGNNLRSLNRVEDNNNACDSGFGSGSPSAPKKGLRTGSR